jgi:glycerate 2-kinase
VIAAGLASADAGRLVVRAFDRLSLHQQLASTPVHLVAAGKAAAPMTGAFFACCRAPVRVAVAIGSHGQGDLPEGVEWHASGHPTPDARSVAAGERALAVARAVPAGDRLVVLLSGGASALMACPAGGLTLDDKQHTAQALMDGGADITALNTVRKHLSSIKGGRLAAACAGSVMTLAISDVVGDDLSVIGSGPGVPDRTTFADALACLRTHGGLGLYRRAVVTHLERGAAGAWADTPAPGDPALARAEARLIGSAADAVEGARAQAAALGYRAVVRDTSVTGEAREAARSWLAAARRSAVTSTGPLCLISAGETTVHVTGTGRGGRNQEFALALARAIGEWPTPVVAASVGTDGIDGPTDAAGALVDSSTIARAEAAGVGDPDFYLRNNDAYAFFHAIGDLVITGRTGTNVGDLQVLLTAGS